MDRFHFRTNQTGRFSVLGNLPSQVSLTPPSDFSGHGVRPGRHRPVWTKGTLHVRLVPVKFLCPKGSSLSQPSRVLVDFRTLRECPDGPVRSSHGPTRSAHPWPRVPDRISTTWTSTDPDFKCSHLLIRVKDKRLNDTRHWRFLVYRYLSYNTSWLWPTLFLNLSSSPTLVARHY